MNSDVDLLLSSEPSDRGRLDRRLQEIGFADLEAADARFAGLCANKAERKLFARFLPALVAALSDSAAPDTSLLSFERLLRQVPDRLEFYSYLAQNPRAVEILVRLFVGSQFLTEILIQQPAYLERLTQHQQLAAFKHRAAMCDEARAAARQEDTLGAQLDQIRRVQNWELLRLGACDQFGLMDLKTVTLQLSLLADSIVQACLELVAESLEVDITGFAVLAMGKLGGEELNYSSDIDLVFLADQEAERFWGLGQQLIRALTESTSQGFLYRVDMRLRPWGRSGPLVSTVDGYLDYLQKHGQLWEKQALLKSRCIAGNPDVARVLLDQLPPILFDVSDSEVRRSVRHMKQTIEAQLERGGRTWGHVKSGPGGIRDVEFLVQGLQLIHGVQHPHLRSTNTLDGLVRLADHGVLNAEEYRCLQTGYAFLRTVEHYLQLMHNKQRHELPTEARELAYLARRLDFPGSTEFVEHYEQHCQQIRGVFDRHFADTTQPVGTAQSSPDSSLSHFGAAAATYEQVFDESQRRRHLRLLDQLDEQAIARISVQPLDGDRCELTVVGYDQLGDLSVICGLLFVFGYNIESGVVFTGTDARLIESGQTGWRDMLDRKFVNVFQVLPIGESAAPAIWKRYEADLLMLLHQLRAGQQSEVHGSLAKRFAKTLRGMKVPQAPLVPVEIGIDNNTSKDHTVLDISASDTVGFLYELTNALSLSDISIARMQIHSIGDRVVDTLHVTDRQGNKLVDEQRLLELRAAAVLIRHFTHLLPASPNPESALLHFRELLQQLFSEPDWINELAKLQDSDVLSALSRLLGVSDFLWHDYLKLQHDNLFSIVTDQNALRHPWSKADLRREIALQLTRCQTPAERKVALNQFKDRQMLRVDLRHILGLQRAFGLFAQELTDVAEVTVETALKFCFDDLVARHGVPCVAPGEPARLAVCALGKCGGRELGFASDIELMFVYDRDGLTDGSEVITNLEFFEALVDRFCKSIDARRQGIFEIDLRLRPYGQAGSLAVSRQAFEKYFGPDGPAWPYERQALVKLRPIAGDREFGDEIVALRDQLLYTGQPFDQVAMRAMRERQLRQLVTPGTFHAKLSPGALVDCEYLIQGLQISHGADHPELRKTNTREALKMLETAGVISHEDRLTLRDAYRFLRRMIDALRMVRGNARDLTVPPPESEEFEFLARRLGYEDNPQRLQIDLESHSGHVRNLSKLIDEAEGTRTENEA